MFHRLPWLSLTLVGCVLGAIPQRALRGAEIPALPAVNRPNILHLHADDFRPDAVHALGNPVVQTPNLDRLVARGLSFSHCYTMGSMVGAVCQPSRTMLLTGRSWRRIPGPKQGDPELTLPRVLGRAGYETFHVGKGGNEYPVALAAFDTNLCIDDATPELRRGSSARHADATLAFLARRDRQRPFYVYFAPPVPHDPRVAEPRFHALYDPRRIPLLPAFLPLHPFDNGEMTVRDEHLAPWPRTKADTRRQLADYYACVTGLDFHLGRIFAALEADGSWTNTLVVFTGDNGLSLGEHGLFGKQNLYEQGGMHVPLVLAGPGIPRGRRDALVYLMDLFPTFCDYAGASAPPGIDGRTLRPVIEGRSAGVREVLYTGYRDAQRSIRDARWKLIRYPLVDQTQLFDLERDPHERRNLAGRQDQAARVKELETRLAAEMQRYGDNTPLHVPQPRPARWTPPAPASSRTNAPAAVRSTR